jgi:hypothetical protein
MRGFSLTASRFRKDGQIASEPLMKRIEMLVRDSKVYGALLAQQRRADLTCEDHCFMARHRKK